MIVRNSVVLALFAAPFLIFEAESKEIELAPIIRYGTPADALLEDPYFPVEEVRAEPVSSSGTPEHALSTSIPLPVQDTGKPGAFAQYRGLGRSAEDVSVQALGVPLNPPQGGGFSFAAFPEFLFSGYRVQHGPSPASLDPRGVAGTVMLSPWTLEAIASERSVIRGGTSYSGAESGQIFAGGAGGAAASGRLSAIGGMSFGKAKGPSGALSARAPIGSGNSLSFHLLASDIDAEDLGGRSFPTPNARFRTQRWIPVAQLDVPTAEGIFKSSVFADRAIQKYDDPDSGFRTHDRIEQIGAENAWIESNWRLGLSARRASFEKTDFKAPAEGILAFQAGRAFESRDFTVEPTLVGLAVTRFGFLPEASVGFRAGRADAWFGRASFSRRVPSMADRYYDLPAVFRGNPGLEPERDWTLSGGNEFRRGALRGSLQAVLQLREDAHVRFPAAGGSTVLNSGEARVGSLLASLDAGVGSFQLGSSLSLNRSVLTATGEEFPYLPSLIGVISAVYPVSGGSLGGFARASAGAETGIPGVPVGGYAVFDLEATADLGRGLAMAVRVDNLLDRRYETFLDFPSNGRTFAAGISGEF